LTNFHKCHSPTEGSSTGGGATPVELKGLMELIELIELMELIELIELIELVGRKQCLGPKDLEN
jgi:hypothetical protein